MTRGDQALSNCAPRAYGQNSSRGPSSGLYGGYRGWAFCGHSTSIPPSQKRRPLSLGPQVLRPAGPSVVLDNANYGVMRYYMNSSTYLTALSP